MAALRHALARIGRAGEGVALHQRHALEMIGKNARREEAGHSAAGDYAMMKRPDRHAQASSAEGVSGGLRRPQICGASNVRSAALRRSVAVRS